VQITHIVFFKIVLRYSLWLVPWQTALISLKNPDNQGCLISLFCGKSVFVPTSHPRENTGRQAKVNSQLRALNTRSDPCLLSAPHAVSDSDIGPRRPSFGHNPASNGSGREDPRELLKELQPWRRRPSHSSGPNNREKSLRDERGLKCWSLFQICIRNLLFAGVFDVPGSLHALGSGGWPTHIHVVDPEAGLLWKPVRRSVAPLPVANRGRVEIPFIFVCM